MSKNNDEKFGTCALCRQECILKKSHIVPKFVFKKIMNSSPIRGMRNLDEPNLRKEDGYTKHLLCEDCEGRFSKLEDKFVREVFRPYNDGELNNFKYEEWLIRFIVSVNWRTLYLKILEHIENPDVDSELDSYAFDTIIENEEILRKFLLQERNDIGKNEVNMIFIKDIIKDIDKIKNYNPYSFFLNSSLDYAYIHNVDNEKSIAVIANLLGIFIYTVIQKLSTEHGSNIRVDLRGGTFNVQNQRAFYAVVVDALSSVEKACEQTQKLSPNQRNKLEKKLKENKEKFEESKIFEHMIEDFNLKNK